MKEVEFFDRDFLDNKIEIGDKVIFETPKYRDFTIGTVISKAPKSCQIEYLSFAGHSKGRIDVVRQCYGQIIKYPLSKEGKWIIEKEPNDKYYCFHCSVCDEEFSCVDNNVPYSYCPFCGAKMIKE